MIIPNTGRLFRSWRKPLANDGGAAMVFLIGMLLTMSVLGTAMFNLSNTTIVGQVSANHTDRAYFMAEAGLNYALPLVADDIEADGEYDDTYNLDGQTFTIDEAGQTEGRFTIIIDDSGTDNIIIRSSGGIDAAVSAPAQADLAYNFTKTPGTSTPFGESLFGGGTITLKKNATVDGDLSTNASDITKKPNASVTGTETLDAGISHEQVTFSCADCTRRETITHDTVWNDTTLSYKKLTVSQGTNILIQGDVTVYVSKNFTTKKNTTFTLSDGATLTVYVDNKATLGKGTGVTAVSGDPGADAFGIIATSGAKSVNIGANANVTGTIYAPDAKVNIGNNTDVQGGVIGNQVSLGKNSTLAWDEAAASAKVPTGSGTTLSDPSFYYNKS